MNHKITKVSFLYILSVILLAFVLLLTSALLSGCRRPTGGGGVSSEAADITATYGADMLHLQLTAMATEAP